MTTRIVSDIVRDAHGAIVPSAAVVFRLTKGSYTGAAAYLATPITVTTDAGGAYATPLWCDEEGAIAVRYQATYPDGTTFKFDLPVGDGSPVLMSALRATAPGVPVANLSTLLAAFGFPNLVDVPHSYVGQAGMMLIVNPSETGLIFAAVPTGGTTPVMSGLDFSQAMNSGYVGVI